MASSVDMNVKLILKPQPGYNSRALFSHNKDKMDDQFLFVEKE